MWFLAGEDDRGGDTAGDVHGERGEAEGEDVEPLVRGKCLGLVLDWADGRG